MELRRFNKKSEKRKFSKINEEEFFRLTKLDPKEWRIIQ